MAAHRGQDGSCLRCAPKTAGVIESGLVYCPIIRHDLRSPVPKTLYFMQKTTSSSWIESDNSGPRCVRPENLIRSISFLAGKSPSHAPFHAGWSCTKGQNPIAAVSLADQETPAMPLPYLSRSGHPIAAQKKCQKCSANVYANVFSSDWPNLSISIAESTVPAHQ